MKAVIFDLDGTLLDTLGELADSMNAVLEQLDFPTHPLDAYRYFIGNGMRLLVERALPEKARTTETIEAALPIYERAYEDRWNLSRPYDGIEPLLSHLAKSPVSLNVLSNKPDDFTQKCIATLLPNTRFDGVRGHSEKFPKKPDPASALAMAEAIGCPPSECLFVGDTSVDIETGRNAGMITAGVLWGFREEEELRKAGADHIVGSPAELLMVMDRL